MRPKCARRMRARVRGVVRNVRFVRGSCTEAGTRGVRLVQNAAMGPDSRQEDAASIAAAVPAIPPVAAREPTVAARGFQARMGPRGAQSAKRGFPGVDRRTKGGARLAQGPVAHGTCKKLPDDAAEETCGHHPDQPVEVHLVHPVPPSVSSAKKATEGMGQEDGYPGVSIVFYDGVGVQTAHPTFAARGKKA